MTALQIIPDGDGAWPELAAGFTRGELVGIAGLARGTREGRPTVTVRVHLPNGRVVLAETTLALFLNAADALRARHGDPRQGRP